MALERRTKKELGNIAADCDQNKGLAICPVKDDLTDLMAYILPPEGSPREDYILSVNVKLSTEYPFNPPKLYMINEVWHPHLIASQPIIFDFLKQENWKPATTLHYCLLQLRRILNENDLERDEITIEKCGPINPEARDMFLQSEDEYKATALEYAEGERGNVGKGEEDFNDCRMSCLRKLLSIPGVVNYNICIYRKVIDARTVQLAFVFCPDGIFYKSNAEEYANIIQLGTKLTPCQFLFVDEDVRISLPPKNNWSATASQPHQLIITKDECDRDPRQRNPPPTCIVTVKWITKERQPERFNGTFLFNQEPNGKNTSWSIGFDHPALLGEFDLKNKRGLAIIINCDYILGHQQDLPTTNDDGDEMEKTLKQFDYDIRRLENEAATEKNIKKLLSQAHDYLEEYDGESINDNDQKKKVIIFAFAGHGKSRDQRDYIESHDGKEVYVMADIVSKFLGMKNAVMEIPKLFLFDACRGGRWLDGAEIRGDHEKYQVNFRIDYATLPEYAAYSKDPWMKSIAKTLREEDISYDDVIATVNRDTYQSARDLTGNVRQVPETLNRLVAGPLKLYYKPTNAEV